MSSFTCSVSFSLPADATPDAALAYVEEALRNWHGCLQPPGFDNGDGTVADGDPMFDLDYTTVTVTMMTNDQIKELATYGAQERLKELDAQRVKIDEEREALMAFLQGGAELKAPVPVAGRTTRKPATPAQRKAASERMLKVWAKRRRDKKKAEKAAAEAGSATSPEPELPMTGTPQDTPVAP